jgi:hypothetical protein
VTSPVVASLLSWADEFAAGQINDPALVDGSLDPGEHVAVRLGPVVEATLAVAPVPTVASAGATGILLATDRRIQLLVDGAVGRQWVWATDVGMVVALRDGLGVQWSPSESRRAAGVTRLEGLVVPALVHGRGLEPSEGRVMFPEFMKVQAAWRAHEPGGLAEWAAEFRQRYAR